MRTTFQQMVDAQADRFRWFFSQTVDMTANGNRSAEQQVRDAQAMRAWADSRADNPSFAPMVARARQQAAQVMQRSRPRVV